MLKREPGSDGEKITFAVETAKAVSVVGDFNGWDPGAHPLQKRSNGKRSVSVVLPPGKWAFRYLADGDQWFDDPDADDLEPNGFGQSHGVLLVEAPPAKTKRRGAKLKP